ncbi:MAG: ATP-binding protein [Pseudomonadota bacterium]
MKEKDLQNYLLQNFPKENEKCEWKEFKSLKNSISGKAGDDVISYISAIANMRGGHLVLGVQDETLKIFGIKNFDGYSIDNIKFRILGNCQNLNSDEFRAEELITSDTKKIIWIFHIPKHSFRLPVYAHKKGWQRIGDSLVGLTQARLDAILHEVDQSEDWSSKIVADATIKDLDHLAITKARIEFAKRNPKYASELKSWNDTKFLDKAKLTIKGKITRTSLILLGKEEAAHFLGSFVKIRWELKTLQNQIKAGEIFSIPFILCVNEVYSKIRNLKYVYLAEGTLFPEEFLRYEPFSIRESINNAIAHQDYSKGAMINVIEFEDDHLVFSNYGSFLPKSVEDVVLRDNPEEIYRNPFLVEAMKNLNMIETHGGGIRKIFEFQRKRFFPMPNFDFAGGKVKITITGKVINDQFVKILLNHPDLTFDDILLLDKIQQHKPITDLQAKHLKKLKLIEGRKRFYLSHKAIKGVDNEELRIEYMKNRSFDDDVFKKIIIQYLEKFGRTKRSEINNLIIPKLSAVLSDDQKKIKVRNMLTALKNEEKIKSISYGVWELIQKT